MNIRIENTPLEQVKADTLLISVFEGRKETRFGASDLTEAGEIAGKAGEITLLHHVPGVTARRVLLLGGGKADKFTPAQQRKSVATAVRYLKPKSVKSIAFAADPQFAGADYVSAAVEGAILGDYEPDRLKTGNDKHPVEWFAVIGSSGDLKAAVERGRVLAEAQNFTRALANEPANLLTPLKM